MNYEEFKEFKESNDNNFVKRFLCGNNHFYIEPAFYTQLMGLKEIYPIEFDKVLNEIKKQAKEHKAIAFVYDCENPFLDYKNAILREFADIADACRVFYEDKSRGSDYGD